MSYLWMTNVAGMKKNTPHKKPALYRQKDSTKILREPEAPALRNVKPMPAVKDFTYSEFKKIADKTPFTQVEWAAMLHISERTLQRYAKNNGSFAPINAERAVQIAKIIQEGKVTFGKVENFYNWLKEEPFMLEGRLSLQSLSSFGGIQQVSTQLNRIQHGLFA
jgi:putative toxin-antitoxin system antitoxin component (TIGR02293 family)